LLVGAFAAATAIGVLLFENQKQTSSKNEHVADEVANITRYQDLRIAVLSEGSTVATYYALRSPKYARDFRQARLDAETALAELRQAAVGNNAQAVRSVDELRAAHDAVASQEEQVLQFLERDDVQGASAFVTGQSNIEANAHALVAAIQAADRAAHDHARAALRADDVQQLTALRLTLSIVGAGVLVLLGLAAATLLWVVKPLGRAARVSQALANGDLTARIDEAGPLELARLGVLSQEIVDTERGSESADGCLTVTSRKEPSLSCLGPQGSLTNIANGRSSSAGCRGCDPLTSPRS
jgi:HAMP domain-containing protein